jgi:hypothetical protein
MDIATVFSAAVYLLTLRQICTLLSIIFYSTQTEKHAMSKVMYNPGSPTTEDSDIGFADLPHRVVNRCLS